VNEPKKFQNFYAKRNSNMYKIIPDPHIYSKINRYGDLYLEGFISRFSDTGLGHAEVLIQKQYLESSDLLVDSIIDTMYESMSREIVPYAPLENGMRETSMRLGARRIFIQYEEDQDNLIRYITDIEILRR
jgi:hypothetical protein